MRNCGGGAALRSGDIPRSSVGDGVVVGEIWDRVVVEPLVDIIHNFREWGVAVVSICLCEEHDIFGVADVGSEAPCGDGVTKGGGT